MNILDLCLLVLVALYALSGYWQGFVAGAFATLGLVLGGIFGIWLVPHLLGESSGTLWVSLGALFVVLVCASVGQAVLQFTGTRIRERISWQPVRALDAVGGAALSVIAVLLVAWMLGVAVSGSRIPGVTPLVQSSRVLQKVDQVMPQAAQDTLRSFDDVVGSSFFPRYLEPFAPERIVNVRPAPGRVVRDPDIARAARSVVKVRGDNRCGDGVEGSGFVFAPHRVMTNAHVVAGVRRPYLRLSGGATLPTHVVYYNPDIDVAVLAVPQLSRRHLRFQRGADAGRAGAVLGYPLDGPFDAEPARIRAQQRLRSPNIYGDGTVTREVFSVRSRIRQGNSGGPLVATDGRVLGVVFAASISDGATGYALTADQVADAAATGIAHRAPVSTGGCA